jgi:uncharacterized HAD superfamily protein
MHIGVDLDNVLNNHYVEWINWHNTLSKQQFALEDIQDHDLSKLTGRTHQEEIAMMRIFEQSVYFSQLVPLPGAREGTELLAHSHRLTVVTARSLTIQPQTEIWIGRYFPERFSEIKFTNQAGSNGHKTTKGEVCRKRGIELLIEDSREYAEECHQAGIPVLLLDYPWNQGNLPDRIYRVRSWEDIVATILAR